MVWLCKVELNSILNFQILLIDLILSDEHDSTEKVHFLSAILVK